jgi:hypothetical protein
MKDPRNYLRSYEHTLKTFFFTLIGLLDFTGDFPGFSEGFH